MAKMIVRKPEIILEEHNSDWTYSLRLTKKIDYDTRYVAEKSETDNHNLVRREIFDASEGYLNNIVGVKHSPEEARKYAHELILRDTLSFVNENLERIIDNTNNKLSFVNKDNQSEQENYNKKNSYPIRETQFTKNSRLNKK